MPTQPIPDLLFQPTEEERQVFRSLSNLIQEVVNFGTHVLSWHADSRALTEKDLVSVIHFRHGLDLLFAICALVGNGVADPTKALLRVLMETYLALKYLLKDDSDRRALCYIYCNYQRELTVLEKVIPGTPKAADLKGKLRRDIHLDQLQLPPSEDVEKEAEKIRSGLAQAKYQPIEAENQRLRDKGQKNAAWYTFFGGPTSIEQVADKVGEAGSYEILYRYCSGIIHGTSILKGAISEGGIAQLRSPKDLTTVTKNSVNWGFALIDMFTESLIPDREKDVNEWYIREIRGQLMPL